MQHSQTVTDSRCVVKFKVSKEEAEELWLVYEASFERVKFEHPCRQSFNKAEFDAFMIDPEVAKFLVLESGQIVAGSLVTKNLAKIPWISKPFFDTRYPEYIGKRMYAQSFFVRPNKRARGYLEVLARALRDHMRNHEIQITFCDFGGRNAITLDLILKAANARALGTIETQVYDGIIVDPDEPR